MARKPSLPEPTPAVSQGFSDFLSATDTLDLCEEIKPSFNPQVRRPSRRGMKTAERFSPVIPARGIGIEYTTGSRWAVHLDGKKTGHIVETARGPANTEIGYHYETLSGHKGETFPNFAACRASLD